MAFYWRADDGLTLNAGLVTAIFQRIRTCIARNPYILVIFQGVGGGSRPPAPPPPPPPSGSAHVSDQGPRVFQMRLLIVAPSPYDLSCWWDIKPTHSDQWIFQ